MFDVHASNRLLPPVVDVEFTAYCNLKCGYCFGPVDDRSVPNLPTEFWLQALGWLREYDVKGIVVSGGEPTIHRDIVPLLRHAKELGLSVVLSTHGRFTERVLACAPFTDWIALPVDAVTSESLSDMRGSPWGLGDAQPLIASIAKVHALTRIKLGTVATKQNLHELPMLARELLRTRAAIHTWKIYQYTPRRQFKSRAAEFVVSDPDYKRLSEDISSILGEQPPFSVVFSSNQSRNQAYLFVYPDGTVAVPNIGPDMGDIIIGNLFSEGSGVFDRVRGVLLDNHLENYRSTYG